jgi:hypothetical protein
MPVEDIHFDRTKATGDPFAKPNSFEEPFFSPACTAAVPSVRRAVRIGVKIS